MEHIYFEAQLCSEIATLKEKSKKNKRANNYVWRIECSLLHIEVRDSPARDIWFLCVMVQGSNLIGRLVSIRQT